MLRINVSSCSNMTHRLYLEIKNLTASMSWDWTNSSISCNPVTAKQIVKGVILIAYGKIEWRNRHCIYCFTIWSSITDNQVSFTAVKVPNDLEKKN